MPSRRIIAISYAYAKSYAFILGVAAAAIYIASVVYDQRKTQKTIADTVGVTEVTIRNRYKELAKNLDITMYL